MMRSNRLHTITGWLLTILSACLFVGCDTADHSSDHYETTDIMIRIIVPYESSGTKAEGEPVADQTPLVFNNGLLVFSDVSGEIVFLINVVNGMSAGNVIGINDLTSSGGALIEDVPNKAVTIDFYGNLPAGITTPAPGADIDDFRATVTGVITQKDNGGGISNVSIYGSGTINHNNRPYKATFDASAIVSRIEVGKLEADGTNIISFDLAGVFINHFYPQAGLTGSTGQSPFIEYTSTNLFEENGEIYYSTAYKTALYDYEPVAFLGQLSGYEYTPVTAGNGWVYNIFSGNVPHIIFRLENVKASPAYIAANNNIDPFNGKTWYITVSGFRSGSNVLTGITSGEVYTLAAIEVSPDTLSPVPEPDGNIKADVEVKIMQWIEEYLPGELPHFPWDPWERIPE